MCDPPEAKRLLGNVSGLTGGHPKTMGGYPFIARGHVMVGTNGEQWKARRNAVKHLFTTTGVKDAFALMYRMQDRLMAKFDKGGCFDIQEEFLMYSFDYASNSQYGVDFECMNGSEVGTSIFHLIDKLMVEWFAPITGVRDVLGETALRVWEALPFGPSVEYNADQAKLRKLVIDNIVTPKRKAAAAGEENMLSEFMKMDNPDAKRKLTDEELACDIIDLYVAGYDTTGHTVAFTIFILLNHPDKLAKLVAEIDGVLGDKEKPTYDDLKKMPYLDAAAKEAARRYPASAGATFRILQKDDVISGVKVKKGTQIWVPVHAMHNCERLWDAPHEYRPERWLAEGATEAPMVPPSNPLGPFDAKKGMPGPFLTFIAGPRACLGQQLGYVHSKAILATFLHNYTFTLNQAKTKPDAYPKNLFAMHYVEGLHMQVERRKR